MISVRFKAFLSTILLVVGALLVGEALHGGVVTGTYGVTSPYVVLRLVLGLAFIGLGYRFRSPIDEYVQMPSGEPSRERTSAEREDPTETGEFDPEMSPLGEDGLERVDAEADERADPSNADDRE